MSRAIIKINGTDGSNPNVPLNTLVQLDNDGDGSELTWLWSIVDQPMGPADSLSSTSIHNPTITPKKEGTYLLQLIVDFSLPSQHTDVQLFGIAQLKTGFRVPASQEQIETGARGWSSAVDLQLQALTNILSDSGIVVAVAGGSLVVGQVAKLYGTSIIKTGLPGQESIPTAISAAASTTLDVLQPLGIILGVVQVGGGASGNAVVGQLVQVRKSGLYIVSTNYSVGTWVAGYPVYMNNLGILSSTPGTNFRVIGRVSTVTDSGPNETITMEVYGDAVPPVRLEFRAGATGGQLALPTNSVVDQVYASAPMVIPSGCACSQGGSVGGTSSTTFNINQNGSTVATVTYPTSGTGAPTFTTSGGAPVLITTGDKMELVSPSNVNNLLSVMASVVGA